jgi:DNA-binding NarL/FixJ family response regulator
MELTVMSSPSTDRPGPVGHSRDEAASALRRALVIDDDARSASHFKETLDRMGLEVSTARTVGDAVSVAASGPPDLLVLTMPERDATGSLNLAAELSLRHGTACVFVLERVDRAALQEVISAGAQGVLCKPVHREQLEATFRLVLEQRPGRGRGPARHDDARARLLEGALHRIAQELSRVDLPGSVETTSPSLCGLRPREHEVVRLLLQHLRVPAIARRLGISQQTVRNHLKSVFRRTGVRSQQELLDRIALTAASQSVAPVPDGGVQIGHRAPDPVVE